jgi:hypothetical protein
VVIVGESVGLSLIAKATVVTALAIAGGWLARHRRAAVRHLIFAAAFAALALLPVATAVIPAVSIPVRVLVMPVTTGAPRATPADRAIEGVTFRGRDPV